MTDGYRLCRRCVMDSRVPAIAFSGGVCNYCTDFLALRETVRHTAARDALIAAVKASGRGQVYDCIMGISGGVDSSYALYLAVRSGLRPLAVHLDNGWNSAVAAANITNLVTALGVDLHTHVIDWEENRDLQRAFLAAHVIDIELLTDNAILALNYAQAARHRLGYILAGTNVATEGLAMPPGWTHFKYDARNIRRIHRRFGTRPIRTHPLLSAAQYFRYVAVGRIRWTSFLDYFPYDTFQARETLRCEVGYAAYGDKHHESVFTRFYQAHILPRKFGVDKRRVHLATLVASGQMTRQHALRQLEEPPYGDERQEKRDRAFVLKKLGLDEPAFEAYLGTPAVPHAAYGSEHGVHRALARGYGILSRWLRRLS